MMFSARQRQLYPRLRVLARQKVAQLASQSTLRSNLPPLGITLKQEQRAPAAIAA